MSAVLSVSSSTGLRSDCAEVVEAMRSLGIAGDVTPNVTVVDGVFERGCRVVVASRPAKAHAQALWEALRARHALTCAHVTLTGEVQSGCVLDVFRPSVCPGRVT